MWNISWFCLLNKEDLLFFLVIYFSKCRVFWFWTVGWTKGAFEDVASGSSKLWWAFFHNYLLAKDLINNSSNHVNQVIICHFLLNKGAANLLVLAFQEKKFAPHLGLRKPWWWHCALNELLMNWEIMIENNDNENVSLGLQDDLKNIWTTWCFVYFASEVLVNDR